MSKKQVAVLIPVYKEKMTLNEQISFKQCIKVLHNYPIYIICPDGIDLSFYKEIAEDYKKNLSVKTFHNLYFKDTDGYNQLMLSKYFYKSFLEYQYMLIYQLDAYVFRDELEYWCQQKWDYIGAPWFENYGSHEEGDELMSVGNGGFSLRNVTSVYNMLNYKLPLQGIKYLYLNELKTITIRSILVFLLKVAGFRNNANFIVKRYLHIKRNEDRFFCNEFVGSKIKLNIPNVMTALQFSFDKSPEYLYQLNGNKLPFGCHAWYRNDSVYTEDVKRFWGQFI